MIYMRAVLILTNSKYIGLITITKSGFSIPKCNLNNGGWGSAQTLLGKLIVALSPVFMRP